MVDSQRCRGEGIDSLGFKQGHPLSGVGNPPVLLGVSRPIIHSCFIHYNSMFEPCKLSKDKSKLARSIPDTELLDPVNVQYT